MESKVKEFRDVLKPSLVFQKSESSLSVDTCDSKQSETKGGGLSLRKSASLGEEPTLPKRPQFKFSRSFHGNRKAWEEGWIDTFSKVKEIREEQTQEDKPPDYETAVTMKRGDTPVIPTKSASDQDVSQKKQRKWNELYTKIAYSPESAKERSKNLLKQLREEQGYSSQTDSETVEAKTITQKTRTLSDSSLADESGSNSVSSMEGDRTVGSDGPLSEDEQRELDWKNSYYNPIESTVYDNCPVCMKTFFSEFDIICNDCNEVYSQRKKAEDARLSQRRGSA